MPLIYPIVEGHGEVDAVPLLVRRVLAERLDRHDYQIASGHRVSRGKIAGLALGDSLDMTRALKLARLKIADVGSGGVIILLDADGDCPAWLGPALRRRAMELTPDLKIEVVVAKEEFEAWLLASVVSLRACRGVRKNAGPPTDPERIRGAKEYLEAHVLEPRSTYSPTADQARMTSMIDLEAVTVASRSFRRFIKAVEQLASLA